VAGAVRPGSARLWEPAGTGPTPAHGVPLGPYAYVYPLHITSQVHLRQLSWRQLSCEGASTSASPGSTPQNVAANAATRADANGQGSLRKQRRSAVLRPGRSVAAVLLSRRRATRGHRSLAQPSRPRIRRLAAVCRLVPSAGTLCCQPRPVACLRRPRPGPSVTQKDTDQAQAHPCRNP
jgi:hypothetical protein